MGDYINLDFAHLVALSQIDRQLREALLAAVVDIEHFAKLSVLNRAETEGEDGYAIVDDYLASLNHDDRNRTIGGLKRRSVQGPGRDMYAGDLIEHHIDACPVWVFLEVAEFGRFVDFYRFCAERWSDDVMLQEHYVLKNVKALRNAVALNSCLANGFATTASPAEFQINSLILAALNKKGLKNSRIRRGKMNSLRVAQIAATLYELNTFCSRESTLKRHAIRLSDVKAFVKGQEAVLRMNNGIVSFFDFIWKLVDFWAPNEENIISC